MADEVIGPAALSHVEGIEHHADTSSPSAKRLSTIGPT
jgi:hypothetical protein